MAASEFFLSFNNEQKVYRELLSCGFDRLASVQEPAQFSLRVERSSRNKASAERRNIGQHSCQRVYAPAGLVNWHRIVHHVDNDCLVCSCIITAVDYWISTGLLQACFDTETREIAEDEVRALSHSLVLWGDGGLAD